jgi:hypothetical protein
MSRIVRSGEKKTKLELNTARTAPTQIVGSTPNTVPSKPEINAPMGIDPQNPKTPNYRKYYLLFNS